MRFDTYAACAMEKTRTRSVKNGPTVYGVLGREGLEIQKAGLIAPAG